MSAPDLGQWGEWRRLCAIDRCARPTAAALSGLAMALLLEVKVTYSTRLFTSTVQARLSAPG